MRTMEGNDLEALLKKTIAPNGVRGHLVNNEQMHDVVFILGPHEELMFAHKLFLISASPIFHGILAQDHATTLNIKISQISKNTMIEICRFAYTENVNLTQYNMFDVLHAASKFEMSFLVEKVVDFMGKQMNENSVFKILENNQQIHNWQINKKCFEFIEKNHQRCLKSKSWPEVSPDLLRLILQNCKIPEAIAKEGLTKWSKSQGHGADDLDEMLALVSLGESDTESVVSETTGKKRRQRSRVRSKVAINPQPSDGNKAQTAAATPKKVQAAALAPTMPKMHGLMFLLEGPRQLRSFKFADLNLLALKEAVIIEQIEFIYNLSATDTKFELKIGVLENSNRKQIYYENVLITESLKRHKLKGKCTILGGQKMYIRIEFPQSENRPTFEDCSASPISNKDLMIFKDPNVNSYAQIIEFVFYAS